MLVMTLKTAYKITSVIQMTILICATNRNYSYNEEDLNHFLVRSSSISLVKKKTFDNNINKIIAFLLKVNFFVWAMIKMHSRLNLDECQSYLTYWRLNKLTG